MCDYFLSKVEIKDESHDQKVIEDLKEDAANIHMGRVPLGNQFLTGLDSFMRGMPSP
jgi:hypothetical protein